MTHRSEGQREKWHQRLLTFQEVRSELLIGVKPHPDSSHVLLRLCWMISKRTVLGECILELVPSGTLPVMNTAAAGSRSVCGALREQPDRFLISI